MQMQKLLQRFLERLKQLIIELKHKDILRELVLKSETQFEKQPETDRDPLKDVSWY